MPDKQKVTIQVNEVTYSHDVEPRLLLVHYIRDVMGLTGAHVGCETSVCGACTVMLNGMAVKACTVLAVQANGGKVLTIEGLAQGKVVFASEVSARDGELKFQSIALWMVMFLLYSVILLGWKGRTPGKTLFKLRVYGMNGDRVGFLRSLGRCLLYILSAIPLGLGFVWIFVDRNHQGWHDKVAETQVVFEE